MPSIDLKDQYFGCEIEMTGLTRQQAAEAVASLFGTNAVHSRSSRTYDPWEVTDNEGKTWRFVYDSSIHGSHRTGRQQIPIGDGDYKVEMNSPKLEYSEMGKLQEVVRTLRHAGAVVNGSCGTVEYDEDGKPFRLDTVILSAQHSPEKPLDELCWELTDKVLAPALQALPPDENMKILLNPSGRFVLGGPEADTGLTGRKLMVDSYGVFAPHGGGAFSGKDPTKVDRSGAYMARYIAKNLVAAGLCEKCQVTLAYAIGKAEPVMVEVDTFGTGTVCADDCLADAVRFVFGLTPAEIIAQLDLLTPRYTGTAAYGHFGKPEFPWERTDQAKILRAAVI